MILIFRGSDWTPQDFELSGTLEYTQPLNNLSANVSVWSKTTLIKGIVTGSRAGQPNCKKGTFFYYPLDSNIFQENGAFIQRHLQKDFLKAVLIMHFWNMIY